MPEATGSAAGRRPRHHGTHLGAVVRLDSLDHSEPRTGGLARSDPGWSSRSRPRCRTVINIVLLDVRTRRVGASRCVPLSDAGAARGAPLARGCGLADGDDARGCSSSRIHCVPECTANGTDGESFVRRGRLPRAQRYSGRARQHFWFEIAGCQGWCRGHSSDRVRRFPRRRHGRGGWARSSALSYAASIRSRRVGDPGRSRSPSSRWRRSHGSLCERGLDVARAL